MIVLSNVVHHYGVRPILRGINLTIERGDVVAVVGPNGTGKSTLLGIMGGQLCPQIGQVAIDGLVRRRTIEEEQAIRRVTFFLPDYVWLPGDRSGREYLLSVGRLYGVEEFRLMDHVQRLLELFELEAMADQDLRSYSSGQKKKIALAAALVSEARYLLLDEPFSGGLDPSGILAMKRVLQRHPRRRDMTVVLTSPVPELIEEVANRVVVLKDGRVLVFETVEGIKRLTGGRGSLSDALERLIFPETIDKLDRYFQEERLPEWVDQTFNALPRDRQRLDSEAGGF